MHRHGCPPGKNTTDIALIIDAMDLLHGGRVDSFCLVTLDDDYSELAIRICEQGLAVFGFGVSSPHPPLTVACMQFRRLIPRQSEPPVPAPAPSAPPLAVQEAPRLALPPSPDSLTDITPRCAREDLRPVLTQAVRYAAQDNGWALLAAVGYAVLKRRPGFSVKDHGCARLGKLMS